MTAPQKHPSNEAKGDAQRNFVRIWDTEAFRDEVEQLCRARNPLLYIVTHEEDRALNELRAVGERLIQTVV